MAKRRPTEHQDSRQWDEYWAKRADRMKAAKDLGLVVVTRSGSRLQIMSRYDPLFVELAKGLEAKWFHKTGVWSFASGTWTAALNAVVKCYGRSKLTPDWLHYMDTENKKHER